MYGQYLFYYRDSDFVNSGAYGSGKITLINVLKEYSG
jgi:predicted ATPase